MPIRLDDDVHRVLERCKITASYVKLPDEELDRKLYLKVNKVLAAAGGKWAKKARAHVFKKDPRKVLGLALATGAVESAQQKLQAFYTPPELAAKVVRLAKLRPGCTVLEPSAGEGALIKAALEACPELDITAYDINPEAIPALSELGTTAESCDFLAIQSDDKSASAYDRILMNPPFTKRQDVRHVLHALDFLGSGGRLVAIVSPSALDGSIKEQKSFQRVMKDSMARVLEVEAGAFRSSGTHVATRIVVVDESPLLHAALIKEGLRIAQKAISSIAEDLGKRARGKDEPAIGPQLDLFREVRP